MLLYCYELGLIAKSILGCCVRKTRRKKLIDHLQKKKYAIFVKNLFQHTKIWNVTSRYILVKNHIHAWKKIARCLSPEKTIWTLTCGNTHKKSLFSVIFVIVRFLLKTQSINIWEIKFAQNDKLSSIYIKAL